MENKIDDYIPVIGLEIHAQLSTKSKMFSPEPYEYGSLPNSSVSNITLAHPGTLPQVNKKAIEYAIKMGLSCKCSITKFNVFARKNYFYPDLPKGYQITQHQNPICYNGHIIINNDQNREKKIGITRIHIEEDTGKSLHGIIPNKTLIDFNRAGAPLIEIVTEPDIRCSKEAYILVHEIRKLVRYLGICDGNMEEGSLRCDANVSVMKSNAKEYGQKVEIKNMNSIRNIQLAIEHEIKRQIKEIRSGNEVKAETRTFDASSGETKKMRSKESLSDYRYFVEPDISPIEISEKWIDEIKSSLPILANEYKSKFKNEYKLSNYDATILSENKNTAIYFEKICNIIDSYKLIANWIMGPIKSYLNEVKIDISKLEIPIEKIADIIKMIDKGDISFSIASNKLFPKLLENPGVSIKELIKSLNLIQVKNASEIETWINETLDKYPEKVKLYREGKKGLFGFFMGETMKISKGNIDPNKASSILKKRLDNEK